MRRCCTAASYRFSASRQKTAATQVVFSSQTLCYQGLCAASDAAHQRLLALPPSNLAAEPTMPFPYSAARTVRPAR
jgi:hypothetical protein